MAVTPSPLDDELAARIIEHNIAHHEATACIYDLSHPELRHAFERSLLRRDLDCIAGLLRGIRRPLSLDIGAGTGRLTLQFVRRGWDCVAVDNSPAMLAVLGRRYDRVPQPKGELYTVQAGAEDCAPTLLPQRPVHLVAFSSVLHHLPDYLAVVRRFASLLAPGGVLYITHEPLPSARSRGDLVSGVVRVLDRLLCAPHQACRALAKARLGIATQAESRLVDYHDKPGLDIDRLGLVLMEEGLSTVSERVYKDRKTALMAWLDTCWLRTPNWRFRLVARRGD